MQPHKSEDVDATVCVALVQAFPFSMIGRNSSIFCFFFGCKPAAKNAAYLVINRVEVWTILYLYVTVTARWSLVHVAWADQPSPVRGEQVPNLVGSWGRLIGELFGIWQKFLLDHLVNTIVDEIKISALSSWFTSSHPSRHLSLFQAFHFNKLPLYGTTYNFTYPFLHILSRSIWIAFAEFWLGQDLLCTGVCSY